MNCSQCLHTKMCYMKKLTEVAATLGFKAAASDCPGYESMQYSNRIISGSDIAREIAPIICMNKNFVGGVQKANNLAGEVADTIVKLFCQYRMEIKQ